MRPIEPLPGLAPDASLGPAPEQRWLSVAMLVVDERYQRPITAAGGVNIRRIARKFSWLNFAPVVVSPIAGGKYAIVDGQHRTTAAASIGIDSVPCLIIQADVAQQAAAFSALNAGMVRMHRLALYHAALAAGEAQAKAIDAAAREADVTIVRSPVVAHEMKPGQTMAVGAIGALVEKRGRGPAVQILRAIMATRPTLSSPLVARVIVAMANVLGDHKEWRALPQTRLHGALAGLEILDALDNSEIESKSRKGCKVTDLLEATIVTHLDRALGKRSAA